MEKKLKFCALLAALSLLSGCTLKSGDELLAAPQPTPSYQALQTELKKELDKGEVIYASPERGENRSTVQLKDLDNDGEDEAIAFFRGSLQTTSNRFTVVVYKKLGEKYIKTGSVTGSGAAIRSVDYPTFSPSGECGIVISWRLTEGESALGLTVCGFENSNKLVPVLETDYTAFELCDLTDDGKQELVTVSTDPLGKKSARLYVYEAGTMRSVGEVALTPEAKSVTRMTRGYLTDRTPALFVEEKTESGIGLLTDILVADAQAGFRNIAPASGESATFSTYRPVTVYASDVNGDGVTEIPRASVMAGFDAQSSDAVYLLDWYAYGGAQPALVRTTYNSQSEEWRLSVPETWHDAITVSRTSSSAGMNCTTFEVYNPNGANVPLLSIYYLTGDLRTYLADNSSMQLLSQTSSAIYTAVIPASAAGHPLALTMDAVQERFQLISQGW